MQKMTTCGGRIRKRHEKDRVDIFRASGLCEGVAVGVDMEKRIGGWEGAKGGLYNRFGNGRVQDDESVDGHALGTSEERPGEMID